MALPALNFNTNAVDFFDAEVQTSDVKLGNVIPEPGPEVLPPPAPHHERRHDRDIPARPKAVEKKVSRFHAEPLHRGVRRNRQQDAP